jgi:hypothetical protein
MPNTYVALATQTLGTAASSVTFSSIPSGYTDLVMVITGTTNNPTNPCLRFNGDSTTNYSHTYISGNGSTATSSRRINQTLLFTGENAYMSSANISNGIVQIMNYSNATTYKTALSRYNNSATGVDALVGLWRKTPEAITSIEVLTGSANTFNIGSTFSLYGIANADQGSAKATGGIITEDSQYWYHTFGASGAFIPKQSLTCDILQIAGGGSGGSYNGGGGGAGGLLAFTSQSLTAISHNVTVGGGGTGAVNNRGNQGSNSQFASLTASVGGGFGADYVTVAAGGTGGSGGGANPSANGTTAGGSPTSGQGNAGGSGSTNNSTYRSSGGGGGAGAAGGNGIASTPGTAGAGGNGSSAYSSWGIATGTGQNIAGTVWYAGGGGGASSVGAAGNGGATAGNSAGASLSALANSGSGSGGAYTGNAAGNGGSGIVIVRYAK